MDKIEFQSKDRRIRYYSILMEREDLLGIPEFSLPEGFHFVYYKPGDRDNWIHVEMASTEILTYEEGLRCWNKFFEGKDQELVDRMVFIEDPHGKKIATATAFYDINGENLENTGWVHWVAIDQEYQGMKLSKPLISYILNRLRELGYNRAKLSTQTTTWVACKLYLNFGFRPTAENAVKSLDGWRILRTLTGHVALSGFEPAEIDEILLPEYGNS